VKRPQATVSLFKAPWWLPEGHSQTLWRKFSPAPKAGLLRRQRQRIELADGDFIDLDWAAGVSDPDGDPQHMAGLPIVLILHGLCGCSNSPYVLSLQQLLSQRGYHSAAMNLRSCSGEPNRLARAYHSGNSDDLEEVFTKLRSDFPDGKFALIGFSLGANVMLKWLGENPRPQLVLGAVAVSTPFSLALCSSTMNAGLSRIYGRYFLQGLLSGVRSKQQLFAQQGNTEELKKLHALGSLDKLSTLWEFDDRVTAPLHGFRDARDYYQRSSSQNFLGAIQSDTLMIHSINDPIIPPQAIPDARSLPEQIQLEVMSAGGHVGFAAAGQSCWLEHRILRYIELLRPFG
jgi:predicted alpha/beta-fold hydrolase